MIQKCFDGEVTEFEKISRGITKTAETLFLLIINMYVFQ